MAWFGDTKKGRIGTFFRNDPTMAGYWQLNGSSVDNSGNNNNGTDTAILYGQSGALKNSSSINLNGSTSKIVIPDNSILKPSTHFSVIFWFKTIQVDPANSPTYFQSYSQPATVAGFEIQQNTTLSTLRFVVGKNSGTVLATDYQEVFANNKFNDGRWHCACFVHNNGVGISIYVDGVLSGSVAWTGGVAYAATNYVRIGCNNLSGTDQFFVDGNMSEVSLFSRALSAQEISQYYRWATSGKRSLSLNPELMISYTTLPVGTNNMALLGVT